MFYLDGVSFAWKTNSFDQVRAPTGRIYRKKSEGLNQFCTAKGSKVGTGGKVVKFLVATSYDAGVVVCKEYEHMTGKFLPLSLTRSLSRCFLLIQDNDPCQNSRAARIT